MRVWRWAGVAALCCAAWPASADGPTREPSPLAEASAEAGVVAALDAERVRQLASAGRFEQLLQESLDAAAEPAERVGLTPRLQKYVADRSERSQTRRAALAERLAELDEALADDRLEDALDAALRAHELSQVADPDNPNAVRHRPEVARLVKAALDRARAAERDHDWVEAISLYRLLNLLFEDTLAYRADVVRVARHVRVLQTYHPEHLRGLFEERDQRLQRDDDEAGVEAGAEDDGAAPPDPGPVDGDGRDPLLDPAVELDTWDVKLRGVEFDMLKQTVRQAARKHIERHDRQALVLAALDGLLTMLDTEHLEAVLPAMGDAERLASFRQYVAGQRAEAAADDDVLWFEAEDRLQAVVDRNAATLGLPEAVVVYELTQGLTESLDDFSAVIWPNELRWFTQKIDGKFFGIGVEIRRQDGKLTVVTPLLGTPAQKAGLRAHDVIAQVDGQNTGPWSLDRAVREITGPRGTVVTLGIDRVGAKKRLQVPIVRDEIKIESIKGWRLRPDGSWDFWLDRDAGVGYVRMSEFIPSSADKLDAAIAKLRETGELRGLVLDLRFNPGGLLTSAIEVVDRFVEEGPIVHTVDGEGERTVAIRARRRGGYDPSLDVVVLINRGSASASEIVAGVLQGYGRALVVGERSFGKGSVQNVFRIGLTTQLDDEGKPLVNALGMPVREPSAYLKLTTEYYVIPGRRGAEGQDDRDDPGRVIHRKPEQTAADPAWGVTPDLVVAMTDEQVADALELRQAADVLRIEPGAAEEDAAPDPDAILAAGADPQLEAAVLYLQARQLADTLDRDVRRAERE